DQALPDNALESDGAEGEEHEQQRRGQGERCPCRHCASEAGTDQAEREPDLARRRTRQELAQCDQFGVLRLAHPFAADDEFFTEVAEVRDRATERGDSKLQECAEHLRGASWRRRGCCESVVGHGSRSSEISASTRVLI